MNPEEPGARSDDTIALPRFGGSGPLPGPRAVPPARSAADPQPNDETVEHRSALAAFDDDAPPSGPDGDGGADGDDPIAPTGHRRKRSKLVAALSIVGVLALVCSGTVAALAFGLANRYENKVTRQDILGDLPKAQAIPGAKTSPMNFLVLGSDSNAPADATIDGPDGSRSDTIMLVHINTAHTSAFIFSIPRDSFVNVPAGGNWKGGDNKINAAFAFGGAKLAAKTVYNLTKIPLDSAMIVNFDGVQKMVAEVGSVNVCIPYKVSSIHTTNVWDAGCHDMGPAETEDFVRQRKSVPGGDFGRIHDQQLVVKALADKITNEGLLTNPLQLDRLISTAAESVTVDQSTNLRDLVFALKDIRPANLKFATVPIKGTMTTFAGSSVELDEPACQTLYQAVINDKTDDWLAAHPQKDPDAI
jgi:LCP family protein required for cell wall assembly